MMKSTGISSSQAKVSPQLTELRANFSSSESHKSLSATLEWMKTVCQNDVVPLSEWLSSQTAGLGDDETCDFDLEERLESKSAAQSVLRSLFVAPLKDAMPFNKTAAKMPSLSSLQYIIQRVLVDNFEKNKTPSHVLCLGFRRTTSGDDCGTIRAVPELQEIFPNTLHTVIKSKGWRELHAALGDYTMFYILRHLYIFQLLERQCMLQLAGPSLGINAKSQSRLDCIASPLCTQIVNNFQQKILTRSVSSQEGINGKSIVSNLQSIPETKRRRDHSNNLHFYCKNGTDFRVENLGGMMNSIRKKKKHHLKGKTSSPRCVRSTSSKTTTIEKTPPLQTKSRKANGRLVSQLGKTCERSDARASCMPTSKGRCLNSNNSDKNEIKAGQVRMAFSHIEGISCSHFLYSVDMSERLPPGHIMSKLRPSRNGARRLLNHIFGKADKRTLSHQHLFLKCIRRFRSFRLKHALDRTATLSLETCQPKKVNQEKSNVALNKHGTKKIGSMDVRLPPKREYDSSGDWRGGTHMHEKLLEMSETEDEFDDCESFGTQDDKGCHSSSASEDEIKSCTLNNSTPKDTVSSQYSKSQPSLENMLNTSVHPSKVINFLTTSLHEIIPQELIGLRHNWREFRKTIKRFVHLSRQAVLSYEMCFYKMKTSEAIWTHLPKRSDIRNSSDHQKRIRLFREFLRWVLRELCVPLIRSAFYATESSADKNRILYFRKPVWRAIERIVRRSNRVRSLYVQIHPNDEQHVLGQSLGISNLRLLPKRNDVRFIINMGRPSLATRVGGKSGSINSQLQSSLSVLWFEQQRDPSMVGAAVFGLDGLYPKFLPFVSYARNADVKNCFDTVPQEKLFQVVSTAMTERDYLIRRYTYLFNNKGRLQKKHIRQASSASESLNFKRFASRLSKQKIRNAIIVDSARYKFTSRDQQLSLLHKHIFSNVIRIGNSCYRQSCGIAQGSSLSTIFCNYFYGHLENMHLSDLMNREDVLLVRMVDDFFLATTDIFAAITFLQRMQEGFADYGCQINAAKTRVNFDPQFLSQQTPASSMSPYLATQGIFVLPGLGPSLHHLSQNSMSPSNEVQNSSNLSFSSRTSCVSPFTNGTISSRKTWFPWIGLLICTSTLQVRVDYTRYVGCNLHDSLNIDRCIYTAQILTNRFENLLLTRCLPLLMDNSINSRAMLSLNIYQMVYFGCARFSCIVSKLPPHQRPTRNAKFFVRLFRHATHFIYRAVRARGSAYRSLRKQLIVGLAYAALVDGLSRKHGMYSTVLSSLRFDFSRVLAHASLTDTKSINNTRGSPLNTDLRQLQW